MELNQSAQSRRLVSVLPTQRFSLHNPQSLGRDMAQQAVKRIFRKAYGADINEFAPLLLCAHSQVEAGVSHADDIDCVIGLRGAAQHPLFLENYLSQPIEQEIATKHGVNIERNNLVELGNLVAVRSGISRELFITLTFALAEAGIEWACFTATTQVKQLLSKLGLMPIELCQASEQAVANGETDWGLYYLQGPAVCFGNVYDALAHLNSMPIVAAIYPQIAPQVKVLAAKLKKELSL